MVRGTLHRTNKIVLPAVLEAQAAVPEASDVDGGWFGCLSARVCQLPKSSERAAADMRAICAII